MVLTPITRVYAFSDTYGRSKNPFIQDDADAIICTDFRAFPLEPVRREFDIYGRESVTEHVLRLIVRLHESIEKNTYMSKEVKAAFAETTTGVFINAAPRTDKKENGAPFYLALAPGIRIVTTDLKALSSIKGTIQSLSRLPNDDNRIYGPTEQFRSSYTPYLLHPDHGQHMDDVSLDLIPDYPADAWTLSYVDRFGNLMTYCADPEARWEEIKKLGKQNGGKLKFIIGNVSQDVAIGSSLKETDPGALVIYLNGDLDFTRKWELGEDSFTRLFKSAFFQFSKPAMGAEIKIAL